MPMLSVLKPADEDWQGTPASTPHLAPHKPPRITPPPPLPISLPSGLSESASTPTLPSTSNRISAAHQGSDADIIPSPGAILQLSSDPLPSNSPDLRQLPFNGATHLHGRRQQSSMQQSLTSSPSQCDSPSVAESGDLPRLLPAVPSATPTLLIPGHPCRGRSALMQAQDSNEPSWSSSGVRPFPDLGFETDASQDTAEPEASVDVSQDLAAPEPSPDIELDME